MANGAYSHSFSSNLRLITTGKSSLQPQNSFKCKKKNK